MMEKKTPTALFDEFRNDVSHYIKSTIELTKLEIFEKLSIASSIIAYGAILLFCVLLALSLIFITIGFYLGDLFQNIWVGFGIVSLATLFIVIILLLVKKPIKKKIINKVVSFLMEENNKKEKKDKQ
jgi:type IV secretory pathway TrbL component